MSHPDGTTTCYEYDHLGKVMVSSVMLILLSMIIRDFHITVFSIVKFKLYSPLIIYSYGAIA